MWWIGNVPEKVKDMNREDLVDYFGYIFEYSFNKENTSKAKPKEIISNLYLSLSDVKENDKLWCAMVLSALRYFAEAQKYYYTCNVINKVIDNIENITVAELEEYMNKINKSILAEGIPTLIVRPFEITNICDRQIAEYNGYITYIDSKEKLLSIAHRHIEEKNINLKYINNVLLFDRKSSLKYADVITQFMELFISYFNIAYSNIVFDEEYKNIPKDKVIEPLVTAFLNTTLKRKKVNKELVEELTNCLSEIIIDEKDTTCLR